DTPGRHSGSSPPRATSRPGRRRAPGTGCCPGPSFLPAPRLWGGPSGNDGGPRASRPGGACRAGRTSGPPVDSWEAPAPVASAGQGRASWLPATGAGRRQEIRFPARGRTRGSSDSHDPAPPLREDDIAPDAILLSQPLPAADLAEAAAPLEGEARGVLGERA